MIISDTTTYCWIVVALFFFGVFSACTTVPLGEDKAKEQHSENAEENVVFLHFAMRSDTLLHRDSVELTDVLIAKGRLKQRALLVEHPPPLGHLLLTAMDKQQRPLQQVVIEHPLRRTVEYLDDSGAFRTAHLNITEATFFIRLHHHPSIAIVRVEESTEGAMLKFVADVPLHHGHNRR